MKNVYLNVLSRLSTGLSTKKHPNYALQAKKNFFLAKNFIFKFCLLLSKGITGGMKTVYFNVLSRLSAELSTKKNIQNFVLLGKKFDFRFC